MKLAVTGGRDYRLVAVDAAFLEALVTRMGVTELLHGGQSGADLDAAAWARARGLTVTEIPANWKAFGRAAGPIRNRELASRADAVAAFPGNRGTNDMIAAATKRGLRVHHSPTRTAAAAAAA